MADVEGLIPHIIKWEAGVTRAGATGEQLFGLARTKGWSDHPNDRGGATQTGLTLKAYTAWRVKHGLSVPTKRMLHEVKYAEWLAILKEEYWDRWKADQIENQSVANLLVDWVWGSGEWGIKYPQTVLGVRADGKVGPKTLGALNSAEQSTIFAKLWKRRKHHFELLAKKPGQSMWLKGWLNRLNDLKFRS